MTRFADLTKRWLASKTLTLLLGLCYLYFQVWKPLHHLHSNDFKHIYLGMQAIWNGQDPYSAPSLLSVAQRYGLGNEALNPYVYLPFTGIVLGFLKFASFPVAAQLWFVLNHIFLFSSLVVWTRCLQATVARRCHAWTVFNFLLAAAVFSHPLTRTLTAGQLNLVLLLCYAASFYFLGPRNQEMLAAGILGFGAMFKLSPALFCVFFLVLRRWKALTAMVATITALFVVSLVIAGWKTHIAFLPVLTQMGYGRSTWQEYGATFWKDPWNQSINSLLTHLLVEANRVTLSWVDCSQETANSLTLAMSLLLLVAYVGAAWRSGRNLERGDAQTSARGHERLFHATVLLSLLLPSLMWDHYLIMLIIPATWLAFDAWNKRNFTTLTLALTAYLITILPVRFDADIFRSGVGVLAMSLKLFPALLLYWLTIAPLLFGKSACECGHN
ncbi:MAG: DUF2029 domain-containing protein [Candidatus Sumerlaeaceae bacterium]|nr:DUF2029 domain-containing protein [Candidatus Sumerlaeaceae bacterium]